MSTSNSSLKVAQAKKDNEFYTRYTDIEAQMSAYLDYDPCAFRGKKLLCPCDDPEWSNFTRYFEANFDRLGLDKLVCTSYAKGALNEYLTMFEAQSPAYDADKHAEHGKLFVMERDASGNGPGSITFDDYLEGDGDFRSDEVKALRDESDFVVTNPPFALLREFVEWLVEWGGSYIIIGTLTMVTYKGVNPLFLDGKMWFGPSFPGGKALFETLPSAVRLYPDGNPMENLPLKTQNNAIWVTNVDFGARHKWLDTASMATNLKHDKTLRNKLMKNYGVTEYPRYDNYDALEVPFVKSIPSDYDGVMGVPISLMPKFNPNQFEIVGFWNDGKPGQELGAEQAEVVSGGKLRTTYGPAVKRKPVFFRVLIRHKVRKGE